MRTQKEIKDRIKRLEEVRNGFQDSAVARKYSSLSSRDCRESAYQIQQEIQLLKWVLEPAYWNGCKVNADGSLNVD